MSPSILKDRNLEFKKTRIDRQKSDNLLLPKRESEKQAKTVKIRVTPTNSGEVADPYSGKEYQSFQSPRSITMQQQYLQKRRTGNYDGAAGKFDFGLANDELRVDGGSLYGGGMLSRVRDGSLIEEEMSFDELSSRLGGL